MNKTYTPSAPSQGSILIIDDLPENLRLLTNVLKKKFYDVRPAPSAKIALEAVKHKVPDIILLDVKMPDMDGFEVCRRLKADEKTRDVPIIFISAVGELEDKIKAFEIGGVDYITKPFRETEVLARVETQLRLRKLHIEQELFRRLLEDKVLKQTHELVESEKRYRQLVEMLPVGLFRFSPDPDSRFLMANPAAAEMIGCKTVDEILKMKVTDLYQDIYQSKEILELLLKDGIVRDREITLYKSDGSTFTGLITIHLVRDDEGTPLYVDGSITDITEQKKFERQLRQVQKMEAIGTLASGIAHDFNNILVPILSYTELAKIKISKGEDSSEDLDEVMNAGLKARELVKQILMFSRQTDVQKKPIDIIPLIKETLKFLRSSVPTTIEIQQSFTMDTCIIYADPIHIHQILMNLCTNAVHAMKEIGGILTVQLDNATHDQFIPMTLSGEDNKKFVRLSVTDSGHGIPPQNIDRIFDPFFTTKDRTEGTGMGLSVVHGIIDEMNGSISVNTEIDQGTCFNVLLPIHHQKTEKMTYSPPEYKASKGKILFVDDESSVLLAGKKILEHLGFIVDAIDNSEKALELFRDQYDEFDVVITDLTMPKLDGIEFSKELLTIKPDIPIVLCTGFGAQVSSDMIKKTGIRGILMKPMIASELIKALEKAMNQ